MGSEVWAEIQHEDPKSSARRPPVMVLSLAEEPKARTDQGGSHRVRSPVPHTKEGTGGGAQAPSHAHPRAADVSSRDSPSATGPVIPTGGSNRHVLPCVPAPVHLTLPRAQPTALRGSVSSSAQRGPRGPGPSEPSRRRRTAAGLLTGRPPRPLGSRRRTFWAPTCSFHLMKGVSVAGTALGHRTKACPCPPSPHWICQ